MRLVIVIASFFLINALGFAQNQFGAYGMWSKSTIHNSSNIGTGPIYSTTPSWSQGMGAYWVKSFTDKRFGNRKLHGRMLSSFVNSWSLRIGAMAQNHRQKWRSQYYYPNHGFQFADHRGKKRLRYAKAFAYLQHSYPLVHLKKWNAYWYAGANFSYLISADGGIVTWELSGEEIDGFPIVNYYDLPPYDSRYFKKAVIEAAGGIGVTYTASVYLNLTTGVHTDWSVSTVENNSQNLYPLVSVERNDEIGVYDRSSTRGNSRLSNLAYVIGVEYSFHRGEHSRAKF